MLDQLIRAALAEYAQGRKFPSGPNAQPKAVWLNQKDKGGYENGDDK